MRPRLPLRGADLVLTAMPALWRGRAPSNNTILVVECDGPVSAERVGAALDRFLQACPWPAARLRRSRPWGALHWAPGRELARPPVRVQVAPTADAAHDALAEELNRAIDPCREAPVRVRCLDRGPGGGVLVVTWFHPLMDPRGGQNFLAHLVHLDEAGARPAWNGAPPAFVPERDPRPLRERGRIARRSQAHLRALGPDAPMSLGTGLSATGPVRFRQASFADATPAGDRRAPRDIARCLAEVGRAAAELWRSRGLPDTPFLVPIAVDLRRKGEPGPTFGNFLAFHFARFRPSEAANVPALTRALRRQMADAVRDGQVDASAVAMEFLRYRPLSTMLRDLPGSARGETFSFNCADVGEFPLRSVFGRRVLNAYHVPAVLPRPGLGVFFNRAAGHHNVVVVWVEGAVREDEAVRLVESIREGMGWKPAS